MLGKAANIVSKSKIGRPIYKQIDKGMKGAGRYLDKGVSALGHGVSRLRATRLGAYINGDVTSFMARNTKRLGTKLGNKIGDGKLPFEASQAGFNAARDIVSQTLNKATHVSGQFTTSRGGNLVRDIYSSTTKMTVRVRSGGVFETLIPEMTRRF